MVKDIREELPKMSNRDRVALTLSLIHIRLRSVRDLVFSSCSEIELPEIHYHVNDLLKQQDHYRTDEGVYLEENDELMSLIARDLRIRGEEVNKGKG